jgi:hypothetical protein
METKPGEVGGKSRLGTGHAKIGDHRQAQSAADRGAVNGGNDRLFGAEQSIAFDIQMRHAGHGLVGLGAIPLELAAVAEMGARAKCLALRGQYQRAAFVVRI